MAEITASLVKELRERTGAGIMECKEALQAKEGDIEKAIEYLRIKGLSAAAKRSGRTASEGLVGSYIHPGGKIGVLVEVDCETDFVANTDEFKELVKDLSMHVAAANPSYLDRESVPQEVIEKEREIYLQQAKGSGKPEKILDKIVSGKMEKFYQDNCLLEQQFVKETSIRISDLVKNKIAKLGENIVVRRFQRFQVGEKG